NVSFEQVLLVGAGDGVKVGAPFVSGALVKATVVGHGRGEKVRIFKLRRRKHYQKSQGHRQSYTEVRIDDIIQG
ncbi:MAG TPA: 50S ribosomal protein L21, partial [Burkholderiales bacterium]